MTELAIEEAKQAICLYAFGMDTNNWALAAAGFAEEISIDYSAVGMQSGKMGKSQLTEFLRQLLGKPDLRVHTAISQVLASPVADNEFIAYYSVRHYKGQIGNAVNFSVYGWYSFEMAQGLITALKINVQATEGDPTILS